MSDAVGGRGIGCQIGRTSPWSCFTGQGVALCMKCKEELRVLATAGGVQTHSFIWLPGRALVDESLEPSTRNHVFAVSCFCDRIVKHGAML